MRTIRFMVWDKTRQAMNGPYDLAALIGGKTTLPTPEDCVFLEWTGVRDRNGKDIYEADVVRLFDEDGDDLGSDEVQWADGTFSVQPDVGGYDIAPVGWVEEEGLELEVIGNIYENRDLLS